MIDYSQFTSGDVTAMMRLLSEVRELPADFESRAQHLLHGLCELVHAPVGILCELQDYRPGGDWQCRPRIDFGWAGDAERRWNMAFFEGEQLDDPMTNLCVKRMEPVLTCQRRDLIDDRAWYQSGNVNELRRRARIDHCIYSNYRLDNTGRAIGIAIHRAWGEPEFTRRDLAIVDMVHQWQPIYRPGEQEDERVRELPPRQKQILKALQAGLSEKQVAQRLGISQHTVHVYVKSLHRRFQVSSRGELLSLWIGNRQTVNS
jgi:DNA-binding CsgD family transcriptional regulator